MSDVLTIEVDVPERYADAVSTRLRTAVPEGTLRNHGQPAVRIDVKDLKEI